MDRSYGDCRRGPIIRGFRAGYVYSISLEFDGKYANLTKTDLELKERIRRIECLHKELDCIIGPLYSRLSDPIYFNSKIVNWKMWYPNNEKSQYKYRGSEFWREMRKML